MEEYIFVDNESGEIFSVASCKDKYEAMKIAREYFANPEFCYTASSTYVEFMGFDTY